MGRRQGFTQEGEDDIWFKYVDIFYSYVYLFEKYLLCTYYILTAMSALEGTNTEQGF